MIARRIAAVCLLSLPCLALAEPQVRFDTNFGEIVVALDAEKAPRTVENFLTYVNDGAYDGTVFHRVVPGFVIQGGGYDPTLTEIELREPIPAETMNGLSNLRGTIAMARQDDPDSARAQFFFNLADNTRLDRDRLKPGSGYTVFGRVVEGMDVVDAIGSVSTAPRAGFSHYPLEWVVIREVEVVGE